jgi:hypothetical protein
MGERGLLNFDVGVSVCIRDAKSYTGAGIELAFNFLNTEKVGM